MPNVFVQVVRTPDLRKKLYFTLGIIVLYRIGSHVPIPGVDYQNVQTCVSAVSKGTGLLGLVNQFSGGALLQITSSPGRGTTIRMELPS